MNKRRSLKLLSILCALICAVLCFTCAYAAIGYITGVKVSENGRITWDDYPDAVDYWLGVDGGSTPTQNGANLKSRITEAGTYLVEISAYTENGETLLATWEGRVEFDGNVFKLVWSEEDPASQTQKTEEPAEPGYVPREGASVAVGPLVIIILAVAAVIMAVAAVVIVLIVVRHKKR